MAHLGTLHDFAFDKDIDDIRGAVVYGSNDEKLGKIDDVIFDHATGDLRHVVVDTGGWLSSKKFLIPADRIHGYAKHDDAFQADVSKDRIERDFPQYDEKSLQSESDWKNYEERYEKAWAEAPVMHREDRPDLNITPTDVPGGISGTERVGRNADVGGVGLGSLGEEVTEQFSETDEHPHASEDQQVQGDITPHRLAGKFPETVQSGDKIHMSPSHAAEHANPQARVGNESIPNRAWQDNPTGSGGRRMEGGQALRDDVRDMNIQPERGRADVGQWHPRMRRFEEVLRKNRVDVTASCSSCAPAKDRAA